MSVAVMQSIFARYGLAGCLLLHSAWAGAACSVDIRPVTAGDRAAVLLCGKDITETATLTGLRSAGLEISYRQYVRHCAPENRDPGWYLLLRARAEPTRVQLKVATDAAAPLCELQLTVPAAQPPAPAAAFLAAMAESEARYISVNGVRTRYFDKGQGPVLLLVHGGQPSAADFNAWEWQQNFEGLAKHFRVIALDRLGQGYTDNPQDLDDYHNYYPLVVAHLYGFIQALQLERVHLVGHSQGGWPVTRLALDHPAQIASLVIVDSTMVAPPSNAERAIRFYIWHQLDLHPAGGETVESIRRGMESFSYTNNNITEQRIQRILEISRTPKYQAASDWFNANRMSPAHPSFRKLKVQIWEELHAGVLQVPVLIIWGREDPEGSFDAGYAFYQALKSAGTEVGFRAFENAGHVAYMEYPDEFNAVITEFARAHP